MRSLSNVFEMGFCVLWISLRLRRQSSGFYRAMHKAINLLENPSTSQLNCVASIGTYFLAPPTTRRHIPYIVFKVFVTKEDRMRIIRKSVIYTASRCGPPSQSQANLRVARGRPPPLKNSSQLMILRFKKSHEKQQKLTIPLRRS